MDTAQGHSVRVQNLPRGTRLHVETESRTYELEVLGADDVLISGHPRHCPKPVRARLCHPLDTRDCGSILEGTSLRYIHPERGMIRTSCVRRVTAY